MLRLSAFLLALLLLAGQAFAQVSVIVNMKQTGPTNTAGAVLPRVGKNIAATYSATASYNGQPALHAEEQVTGTAWTYTVSSSSDVNYNPKSGNGNSVSVTASSAKAGTYSISVTFTVTFTIETPVKNAQGQYVYDANGNQQFTTRSDGPYSGSGSATLTVKNGKFKIRLEPDDKCNETATNKRSRTRFGLGETGDIIIEPETPGDTVVFVSSDSSATDICTVSG